MAESFWCNGSWVRFTNGAVESLFKAWASRASTLGDQPGMRFLHDFLQEKIEREGAGCRAFDMNCRGVPEDAVEALLVLVRETADDPASLLDREWTDDLVESWQSRLRTMQRALEHTRAQPTH